MPLCEFCEKIDIRAMLVTLAEDIKKRDPTAQGHPLPKDYPRYQHRENILDIGANRRRCKLCALIWQGWARSRGTFLEPLARRKWTPLKRSEVLSLAKNDQSLDTEIRNKVYLYIVDPEKLHDEGVVWGLSPDPAARLYASCGSPTISWFHSVPLEIYSVEKGMVELSSCDSVCKISASKDVLMSEKEEMTEEDSVRGFLAKDVSPNAGSEGCLSIANTWLQSCLSNHRSCRRSQEQSFPLPTRVIDVGDVARTPKLYASSQGEVGAWVSLSYCWGGTSDFVLTTRTYEGLQNGEQLEAYPPTIRDAIIITRVLGVQFLWVDALCIVQDLKSDWENEAPKMTEIYANSLLTINAAGSQSVMTGIFQDRTPQLSCTLPWKRPNCGRNIPKCQHDCLHASSAERTYNAVHVRAQGARDLVPTRENSHWATRGWTFQESLLPWRSLTYLKDQMSWHCPMHEAWEDGYIPVQDIHSPYDRLDLNRFLNRLSDTHLEIQAKPRSTRFKYDQWYNMVHEYSGRDLTRQSDRLAAIGGLARTMEKQMQDRYCAGLWEGDLIAGLLWKHALAPPGSTLMRLPVSNLPSWAWVSVPGSVYFDFARSRIQNHKRSLGELARIENVSLVHSSGIYGAVKSGEIVLTAPRYIIHDLKGTQAMEDDDRKSELEQTLAKKIWDNEEFQARHYYFPGQKTVILKMAEESIAKNPEEYPWWGIHLLVVESVPPGATSTGASQTNYRRVAVISIHMAKNYITRGMKKIEVQALKDRVWPVETMTII